MRTSAAPLTPPRLPLSDSRPGLGLRLWRVAARPRWTLLLLLSLALVAVLGLLLPQAESAPSAAEGQWLATLQGRYGRWTGLLGSLGLFDIVHSLWFQLLLCLVAYQSLIAAAEGSRYARRWIQAAAEPVPSIVYSLAREQKAVYTAGTLDQGVAQTQSALERMGYRVLVARGEKIALLEAVRHPWLSLGHPLAHAGVVLACLGMVLAGRLDWQESGITLSPGRTHGLRYAPGVVLGLDKSGLAQPSSRAYSWVSLLRGERKMCSGVVFSGRPLSCGGMRIHQDGTEPALHVTGYDREGDPLGIQSLRGEEPVAFEHVLHLPSFATDSYAVVPEEGLTIHVETSSDHAGGLFRLEVHRGQQSGPVLEREIAEPTSLNLGELTLKLRPTWVPSFRITHRPAKFLLWAGSGLALTGLLIAWSLLAFSVGAQVEQREGTLSMRLWQVLPLSSCLPTAADLETGPDHPPTRRAET
jgi:hypothetical protein